jgi:hypothetical protein
MDSNAVITILQSLINEIRAGSGEASAVVPPGMVAIRPVGAHGQGKVRFWPQPYANLVNPATGEMILAYADRCSTTVNPATNTPYWVHGRWPQVAGFNPYTTPSGMAEMLDRQLYPDDWATQEELDRQAAVAAANAGTPWCSTPEDVGGIPISIEGQ